MPEMRYYKVTQTRVVDVVANSSLDALQVASEAFEHGQDANGHVSRERLPDGLWGETRSRVKELKLSTERQP